MLIEKYQTEVLMTTGYTSDMLILVSVDMFNNNETKDAKN